MKIIAMYLPQFHCIPENDRWWGKGYTDWYAVKNAKKLYENHKQPRVPMNGNYYDLLDAKVLEWQAELMKKYGVDGQCFYHYCFKDNETLLEKPAELLLERKDIDMPFCFCWANESWVSSWSNIENSNIWSSQYDITVNDRKDFLMEQAYGKEEQWKEHFDYLLPFFKDSRYILKDNRPIFLIYRAELIDCLGDMKRRWDKLAKENGFDGIYIIAGNCAKDEEYSIDAYYDHEPRNSMNKAPIVKSEQIPRLIDYDDLWRIVLSNSVKDKQTYFCGFVGFDSTPRHGLNGTVCENACPENFRHYLSELIAKSEVYGNEFVFLNAWNEWGEGMYLEPDGENAYAYLEAVSKAREEYKKYIPKYLLRLRGNFEGIADYYCNRINNQLVYEKTIDGLLKLSTRQFPWSEYFEKQGITNIYIYGMGKLGNHFLDILNSSKIKVAGIMDIKLNDMYMNIPVIKVGEEPMKDATVIIALSYDVECVKESLREAYGDSIRIMILSELVHLAEEYSNINS